MIRQVIHRTTGNYRKTKQSQSGLTMPGITIAGLLILVIVLGGALAFKFHEDRSLSSSNNIVPNTASKSTVTDKSADNSQTTKVAAHTLTEGNTTVENTYQQYIQTQNNSRVGAKQGLELIKGSLTPNLYNTLSAKYATATDADLVVCGQTIPSTFGVDSNEQSGGSATYTVNEMYGTTTIAVKVTVDLNQLLISDITCPQ